MWTYRQSNGVLSRDGNKIGVGYSGHAEGLNNHALEADPGVGPIPCGVWKVGPAHDSPHTGPVTMDLDPTPPFDAHGRTLFRMHGDNKAGNESASRGCIIMARAIRLTVANSGDHDLTVIP